MERTIEIERDSPNSLNARIGKLEGDLARLRDAHLALVEEVTIRAVLRGGDAHHAPRGERDAHHAPRGERDVSNNTVVDDEGFLHIIRKDGDRPWHVRRCEGSSLTLCGVKLEPWVRGEHYSGVIRRRRLRYWPYMCGHCQGSARASE